MATGTSWTGPIGDLVPAEAGHSEPLVEQQVRVRGTIVVLLGGRGQTPSARARPDGEMVAGRPGQALSLWVVDRQGVGGEVIDGRLEGSLDGRPPGRHGLFRQVVEQVERAMLDAGSACRLDRLDDIRRLMSSTEPSQLAAVEALRAEADAVHTCRPEAGQIAPLGRPGVGLDGHLGGWREAEAPIDPLEQRRHVGGGQQRRRSATQVDGVERLARRGVGGGSRPRGPEAAV